MLRTCALLASSIVVVAAPLCGAVQDGSVVAESRGVVTSCEAGVAAASFTLGGEKLILSDAKASWPSADYARTVGHLYRVEGACPPAGTPIRVTRCGRCTNTAVITVESGVLGKEFAEAPARLWIVRQFFDVASHRDEPIAVSIAAMVLARYDRHANLRPHIWVRDRIEHVLDSYRSADRAATMIARFGRDDLTGSVPALVRLVADHRDETGLVRAFPYIPVNPRSAPFVGAWGMFASAVYLERPGAALAKTWELRRNR